jgi:hypothetical protein
MSLYYDSTTGTIRNTIEDDLMAASQPQGLSIDRDEIPYDTGVPSVSDAIRSVSPRSAGNLSQDNIYNLFKSDFPYESESQAVGEPPIAPGRPPTPSAGQMAKWYALGMIPIWGQSKVAKEIMDYKQSLGDWQYRQKMEEEAYKAQRKMFYEQAHETFKKNIRAQGISQKAMYLKSAYPNLDTMTILKYATAIEDAKTIEDFPSQELYNVTTKDGMYVLAAVDKQGNFWQQDPMGNTSMIPRSQIREASKVGTSQTSGQGRAMQLKKGTIEGKTAYANYDPDMGTLTLPGTSQDVSQVFIPDDESTGAGNKQWEYERDLAIRAANGDPNAIAEQKAIAAQRQMFTPPSFQFIPTDQGIIPVQSKTGETKPPLKVPGTGENLTKIPNAAKEKIAQMEDQVKKIGDLRFVAERNRKSIGAFQGHGAALGRWINDNGNPEVNELFRIADGLADDLLRMKSGSQINEREYARLRALTPNPRWSESKFFSDLNGFEKELKSSLQRRKSEWGMGQSSQGSGQGSKVIEWERGSDGMLRPKQ